MKDLMKKYPRVVDLDTGNQSISSNQPEEEDIVFTKKIKLEGKWSLFKTSKLQICAQIYSLVILFHFYKSHL